MALWCDAHTRCLEASQDEVDSPREIRRVAVEVDLTRNPRIALRYIRGYLSITPPGFICHFSTFDESKPIGVTCHLNPARGDRKVAPDVA